MRAKAVLTAIILVFLLFGCGYKMVLKGGKAAFTLYPAEMSNRSGEITANQIFINEVKSYLVSINALKSAETADYTAFFTLTNVTSSSAVKLKSGETATVSVAVAIAIEIKDKEGVTQFKDNVGASTTYSQTSSSSASSADKQEAIRNAVRSALENFRYNFENR